MNKELTVTPRCQAGDLWQLGKHRVLCGDSTRLKDLNRLLADEHVDMVFADPPYGINVVNKRGKIGLGSKTYTSVIGDTDTFTATTTQQLCMALFASATHIWWGANYYASKLTDSRCWIVWDKENGTTSFADGELAWTNIKTSVRIFRHKWNGAVRASERGLPRFHPTQKPVALPIWFYEKYGHEHDLIFDPFLGSGITILAAEQTNRRCYGIEIDPHYCDVVLARWEALTGDQAVLLERIEQKEEKAGE